MINYDEHQRRGMGFTFYWVQREWWNLILGKSKMFKLIINVTNGSGLTLNTIYKVGVLEHDVWFRDLDIQGTFQLAGFPKHVHRKDIVKALGADGFKWNCDFFAKGQVKCNTY
jgi:hypothetical protein